MASYLKFTTEFADGTSRNIQIGEIAASSINPTTIKTKIQNFNNPTTRRESFPNFDTAFVSSGGASFSRISAAEIITTERTYLDIS